VPPLRRAGQLELATALRGAGAACLAVSPLERPVRPHGDFARTIEVPDFKTLDGDAMIRPVAAAALAAQAAPHEARRCFARV
jgi:hypothetical protein